MLAAWVGLLLLAGPPGLILVYRILPPPVTPLMLIRLAEGHSLRQDWVPYGEIAPALAEAVIASEDNLFCEQSLGFDVKALRSIVRLRKLDTDERKEQEAVLETYMHALGMLN